MNELYKQYKEKMFAISAYSLFLHTVYFDANTIAPKKGRDYRNERIAFMEEKLYDLISDPQLVELLERLNQADDLTFEQKREVKAHLKDLKVTLSIPKDLYLEYQNTAVVSQQKWEDAKNANDYAMFKPYLLKIIDLKKQMLKYREGALKGYDVYLDDFEPGMTQEKYDAFFNLIKEKLVPLIHKINEGKQIDDAFVYRHYDKDIQAKMMAKIMEYIDFDFDGGVLAQTEHPFTDFFSRRDVRITTHYYENNLNSSIFSVIHEAGHANYNYSINEDLADTYLFDNMSSGMHESQSRLFENYLGRREHFWDGLYPQMKELFKEELADIDQKQFVDAINKSIPSLIRCDADELTYPLHILARYEIEKGIFDGSVDPEYLDEIWDQKYQEYLGIHADKASEGILQDVHWSDGSFGYFPTYALGSGFAAQFMEAMEQEIDVDQCLKDNNFKAIKEWLRVNIHQYGGLYNSTEIMEKATGKPFDPNNYINYLLNKYSKLYQIDSAD